MATGESDCPVRRADYQCHMGGVTDNRLPGYECKAAEQVVLGDYLPFLLDGERRLLEVSAVSVKARQVWITVEEPTCGEAIRIRPRRSDLLAFKEAATVIEEAESRLAEDRPPGA